LAALSSAFDLVIFDNDGVLVDSEPHACRVLAGLLTGYGLPTTVAEGYADYTGLSLPSTRARAESLLGRALPQEFEDVYHARLFEVFRAALVPVPGVVEALARIAAPTCVASSGTHVRIRLALETTGLLPRFDGRIFSAQDVRRGKPAPDLFLLAARTLGAHPARCAVIEDSRAGVEAAAAAGMTAFGFARAMPSARLAGARGGVFASMEELPGLLARGPRPGVG
jgi:HAD superfamily hydrolase (TIGR01509 family)